MCEDLLRKLSPLRFIKRLVEAEDSPASFEAVPSHLQFIHRMDVLNVQFDAGSIWCLRSPHVQIFVSPCLKVECVIAVVEVCYLRQEM